MSLSDYLKYTKTCLYVYFINNLNYTNMINLRLYVLSEHKTLFWTLRHSCFVALLTFKLSTLPSNTDCTILVLCCSCISCISASTRNNLLFNCIILYE